MIRRTYGSVKEQLARVTQNGMCPDSPQLLARTNEAQERIGTELAQLIIDHFNQ